MTEETKTKKGQVEGVEAGTFEPTFDVHERFVQKVNSGNFTFTEDEAKALAVELGVEEEVEGAFVRNEAGPENPLAGLTPATGSGGTPYESDAATEETKKAAKAAKKAVEDGDKNQETNEVARANQKRLAASVK